MPPPKRILFIAPHADDIEILCNSTCQAAVKSQYQVHECLACADEYGTSRVDFRGRRLARIRKSEMNAVSKLYGTDKKGNAKITLHWMPYIDGFVPFTKESVSRYRRLILDLNPWLIFGPDPFFTIDSHPDHLNTGRNYYFALKSIPEHERPKLMLFFQTYRPDFYLPFGDMDLIYRTRIRHRSQFAPLLMKIFTYLGHFIKRSASNGGRLVDTFRKVVFEPNAHRLPEDKWLPLLRFRRGMWQYGFNFGQSRNDFYNVPGLAPILEDYRKNGWLWPIYGDPI